MCVYIYFISFIFLEEEIVRAALLPYADVQMDAIVWLDDHYKNFADHSPTTAEYHLSAPSKRSLHNDYKSECQKIGMEFVEYSKFRELWNATCPHYLIRADSNPDIPGKCKTCAEIEGLRSECNDRKVLHAAKELHQLHRGGLIMNERFQ